MTVDNKCALEPMDKKKTVWYCIECKKYFSREPYINIVGEVYCPFCSSKKIERIRERD